MRSSPFRSIRESGEARSRYERGCWCGPSKSPAAAAVSALWQFWPWILGLSVIALLPIVALVLEPEIRHAGNSDRRSSGLVVAVLGDSDSHAYRDFVNGIRRGGAYHDGSFQWTEIWARVHPEQVDLGRWGVWGTRRSVAAIRDVLGLEARPFRKEDFEFNYARSGARCDSLYRDYPRQAVALIDKMRRSPDRFESSLVVIRIGINDFGQSRHLLRWAKNPGSGEGARRVDWCLHEMDRAIREILELPSMSRIVLVGTSHDYNESDFPANDLSETEILKMRSVLERFERGLQDLADRSPRVIFIDAVGHFRARWGMRFEEGLRETPCALEGRCLSNTRGDEPFHLTLLDGHAGSLHNALWLNHAIERINSGFDLELKPLPMEAVVALADARDRFQLQIPEPSIGSGTVETP